MAQKTSAPCLERKQPDTLSLTFIMRISRSAKLLSNGTLKSYPLFGKDAALPAGIVGEMLYASVLVEALSIFEYALYGLAVDYSNLSYPLDRECQSSNCGGTSVGEHWHPFVTLCGKCHDVSDFGKRERLVEIL